MHGLPGIFNFGVVAVRFFFACYVDAQEYYLEFGPLGSGSKLRAGVPEQDTGCSVVPLRGLKSEFVLRWFPSTYVLGYVLSPYGACRGGEVLEAVSPQRLGRRAGGKSAEKRFTTPEAWPNSDRDRYVVPSTTNTVLVLAGPLDDILFWFRAEPTANESPARPKPNSRHDK